MASDLLILFGTRVKKTRLKIGMKQSELAERTGLTQQYISLIEAGRQNVTIETAEILADAIGGEVWNMLKPSAA